MSFTAPQESRTVQPHQPEPEPAPSAREIKYRHDAANYIAAMLAELRQIAGKANFEKLVTSLDAAYYDAYSATGPRKPVAVAETEKNSPAPEQTRS